jgi:alginate O-acetyltransferase complex protein AlgJ
MNWGESAGLAEQLSFHLQRPVDAILRNDSGAFATRQILATELARGRDRLADKRVVIWQFAARELAVGDWKLIQLPVPPKSPLEPPPVEPLETDQGEWIATASGVVSQASDVPGTGVPYKDHIRALYLTGLEARAGTTPETEAVVYVWDMRDRVLTSGARVRPGDRITLRLQPWENVADQLGRINRSELDDVDLLLLQPWWGETVEN